MSKQIILKRCSKCKENKPLTEFHKNHAFKDGYQYKCKICCKNYSQSDRGKEVDKRATQKYRQTTKFREVATHRRRKERQKCTARNAVNNAITSGKLPRPDISPCNYCPKSAQEYHHHLGYKPKHWLNIVPVCKKCHRKIHKTLYATKASLVGIASSRLTGISKKNICGLPNGDSGEY